MIMYIDERYKYLTKLSDEVKSMGFFPLLITLEDISCFWIRLETKDGKELSLTPETFDDMGSIPDLLKAIKDIARYEEEN